MADLNLDQRIAIEWGIIEGLIPATQKDKLKTMKVAFGSGYKLGYKYAERQNRQRQKATC